MSNAEHLIENAICVFEETKSFNEFLDGKHNKAMAAQVGISLEDVVRMALHILFVFKPDWEYAVEQRMIAEYGYEIKEMWR